MGVLSPHELEDHPQRNGHRSSIPPMLRAQRTCLITSHHGGSGQTTLVVNLAQKAIESGRRVLLVDATATEGLTAMIGHSEHASGPRQFSPQPNWDVLVCSGKNWIDAWQQTASDRERLESSGSATRPYDLILIDGPALTDFSLRSLAKACDEIVLTLAGTPMALRTLAPMLSWLQDFREEHDFQFRGLVVTLPVRDPIGGTTEIACRALLGEFSLLGIIPHDTSVREATLAREPLLRFATTSQAAQVIGSVADRLGWFEPTLIVGEKDTTVSEAEQTSENDLEHMLIAELATTGPTRIEHKLGWRAWSWKVCRWSMILLGTVGLVAGFGLGWMLLRW